MFIFGLFKQTIQFFNKSMQKSPSSIWHQDSSPQPFEYESSPNTTRPGLPPKSKFYHINYTRGETLITSKLVLTFNEFSSPFWMKRNTGFISENHHLNAAERFIKYTKYVYEVKCDIFFVMSHAIQLY